MLYDVEKKTVMLDALRSRVSSIIDVYLALLDEGYIVNKAKANRLQWAGIMIDAFLNIDVMSVEQHNKLESLFDKVMNI